MPPNLRIIFTLCLAAGLSCFSGCGAGGPQTVSPQEFYARHNPTPSPIAPLDTPGALSSLPDARAQLPAAPPRAPMPGTLPDFAAAGYPTVASGPAAPPIAPIFPTTQTSTTNPSTQPSFAENEYMTLGGVVMVVNGTPIYANKVLRLVTPQLRQYARQMDFYDFTANARAKIDEQIQVLRNDELEVAAAERSLDPKQIAIAKQLTINWRQRQIAEAGGSEQVAFAKAEQTSPGEDFQDLEDDQYRFYLWEVYKAFKIDPDIQFTAEDERQYYNAHIDEFTTPTKATIILIEADPTHVGSDAEAKWRLQDIRHRAMSGENFADYAKKQNDLPGASGAQGSGGLLTDIKPNSLVFTKVDEAIWKVPVGQISEVIADNGAYYIFKVVSRDIGETRAFADAAVQDYIKRRLSTLQLNAQREAEIAKLNLEGIANTPDPDMIQVAVEMAKQNYPIWAREKGPIPNQIAAPATRPD